MSGVRPYVALTREAPCFAHNAVITGTTMAVITTQDATRVVAAGAASAKSGARNATLVEAVQSIEDIKLLRAEQRFQNQWNHTNDVASSISMKQRFLTGLLLTWTQEVQSIVYVVVLLVGCFMVMNGDMTTGALVGTTILASRTIAPLSQIIIFFTLVIIYLKMLPEK